MTFPRVLLSEVATEVTVGHVGPMASEYVDRGIPFLRSLNIEPFRINLDDVKFITEEFNARLRKSALRPGDVVIVRTGKPGTCAVVPEWLEASNCSDLVIVRCGPKVLPKYLAYWVNSLAAHHVGSNTVGAVQQHFNVGAAKQMPLLLPSLGDQELILSALATLDDKIELNRRMNETLEAMAQAIFRDWFVDFGPVRRKLAGASDPIEIMGGMLPEADRATTLSALFPSATASNGLPHTWKRCPLDEVAVITDCLHAKKPTRAEQGGLYLQLGNIVGLGMVDPSDAYLILDEDYTKWTSRMEAVEGDCVITNVGRVGAVAQIPQGMRAALGRNMTGIRCKPEFPFPAFLITCLLSGETRREIENNTDAGTILNALNVKNIPKLRVCLGAPELIGEFERIARPLRKKMEANAAENRALAETRDYLLPRLMSGEVSVRDVRSEIAA